MHCFGCRPITLLSWIALVASYGCVVGGEGTGAEPTQEEQSWQELCQPSRVSLKLEAASPREAYARLGEWSGNILEVPRREANDAPAITLSLDNTPFWEAMEAAERSAPVEISPRFAGRAVTLRWRNAKHGPHVAFTGPARLRLQYCEVRRVAARPLFWQPGLVVPQPETVLALRVEVEPRVAVEHARVVLTEVVDDAGCHLVGSVQKVEPGEPVGVAELPNYQRGYVLWTAQPRLRVPSPGAKTLKTIRGKLVLTMTPDVPLGKVSPLGRAGASLSYGGRTLRFESLKGDERKGYTVTVSIGGKWDRQAIRAAPFNRLELISPDGEKFAMDSARSRGTRREYHFASRPGLRPQALVVYRPGQPRTAEFEFELLDVPLPPRAALRAPAASAKPEPSSPQAVPAPETVRPLESMPGSKFTHAADAIPLPDLLAEISRQTGNRLEAPDETPAQLKERQLVAIVTKADFQDVGFWQGIDALCRHASLTWGPARSQPGRLVFRRATSRGGADKVAIGVRYRGPLRFGLQTIELMAKSSIEYGVDEPKIGESFALLLTGDGVLEPKVRFFAHGLSLEECVTDTGRRLSPALSKPKEQSIHATDDDPRCKGIFRLWFDARSSTSMRFELDPEAPPPARLSRVRYYYRVWLYDRDQHIEIDTPDQPATYDLDGGSKLLWLGKARGGRSYEYQIQPGPQGGAPFGAVAAMRRVIPIAARGRRSGHGGGYDSRLAIWPSRRCSESAIRQNLKRMRWSKGRDYDPPRVQEGPACHRHIPSDRLLERI